MRGRNSGLWRGVVTAAALAVFALVPAIASAHCDTLDGPVVAAARTALAKGDVTPVLMWVKADDEAAIRTAFARAVTVRGAGPEARELADAYFFETLVRLHRAGEGAPYTGLKAAGTDPGPAVGGADRALETGSADELVKLVTDDAAAGIRRRFARVVAARKRMNETVAAGREYVEAYVEYVHYVERLHADAGSQAAHSTEGHGTVHEHPEG